MQNPEWCTDQRKSRNSLGTNRQCVFATRKPFLNHKPTSFPHRQAWITFCGAKLFNGSCRQPPQGAAPIACASRRRAQQDEDGTASPPPQVGCGLRNKPPKRQRPRAYVRHPSVRPKDVVLIRTCILVLTSHSLKATPVIL